ncbi:universal stress protein [Mucilaginibacter sp. UR6-11]|uniref:universal stress protein n=1 Tax=Mucilaginibacter sp. UR6-11 TaxID=1435644 RepID=UPI001E4EC735|nr:universal stress protein [Mucilaginibacter sp. UR6-11]MCC8425500.1 universal stress protein [Mucilaginibacter sp. UR6-11]
MKTILVPTDFSAAADNAGRYALQLAKSLHTGIRLVHAFKVPIEVPGAAQVAWPLEDYSSIKKQVTEDLSFLSGKLEQEEREGSATGSYHPVVSYDSAVGTVKDIVRNQMDEQQLNLVAMGMSGEGGLSRFFLGSQSRDLIDAAPFPVLLIPKEAHFVPIRKIAFATDLSLEDVEVIHSLVSLARYLNAEILIAHCADEKYASDGHVREAKDFLAEITEKAGYDHIYYRHVKSIDVEHGLDWLSEHGQIDILSMVHHPRHFLAKLLTGSHTQAMARHVHIPLLVFPPGYCAAF